MVAVSAWRALGQYLIDGSVGDGLERAISISS